MSVAFRIDLSMYRGPMDLLHYLVRKHEVDLVEIPLAAITEQYLEYLEIIEQLDVNAVGDFLELASILIEIKAKLLLPSEEDTIEVWDDPSDELVTRLLEYKKYKDAASMLEERGRSWQQSFSRLANDLPTRRVDPAEQPIREVELWDLVSALGRVMRAKVKSGPSNIVYDDTPIHIHMERIHQTLSEDGRMAFSEAFQLGMQKSAMIGLFLAVLELVRHHQVEAEQEDITGEIWVRPGPKFDDQIDVTAVDGYGVTDPSATESAE